MVARPGCLSGWPVWSRPLLLLALILLGPLFLMPTPLRPLGLTWAILLVMAAWGLGVTALVGTIVGTESPVLPWLERMLRIWVARFAPDPEGLWIHWAKAAHRGSQAHWCLERAARLGGAEALFQEGLAYFHGGFGPGGQTAGVERMRRAARLGHPEAAFWLAEALRTGRGTARQPMAALDWCRRASEAGFGPAAAWLAEAYACGDGVAADPELARCWSETALRLAPHPALSRSPLRHDAAPEDPLIRAQAQLVEGLDSLVERLLAHRHGPRVVVVSATLAAGLALAVVVIVFLVGSAGFFFLPLVILAPPGLMLAWMAWRFRREGPPRGRDRLQEAAEAGDPEACFQLGMAYRSGTPQLPRDDASATAWFRRAAEAGHAEAIQALIQAYLGGHGVLRDPREAARWAEVAQRESTS